MRSTRATTELQPRDDAVSSQGSVPEITWSKANVTQRFLPKNNSLRIIFTERWLTNWAVYVFFIATLHLESILLCIFNTFPPREKRLLL